MFVDAHCHLDMCKEGSYDPKQVLPIPTGHTHNANVKTVAVATRNRLPYVIGIAPQTAQKEGLAKLDEWEQYIRAQKPVAIGEIGLDNHWATEKLHKDLQIQAFARMVALAEDMRLPIVIHAREATTEVMDYLESVSFSHPVMLHFFSGSVSDAKRAVKLGGVVSIPCVGSSQRKTVIKELGIESVVVETDAPAVGKSPGDVVRSIEYVSKILGLSFDSAANKTADNACRFFNIKV